MSRKLTIAALLLTLGSATSLFACLWDSDTLQMERLRFPGVLEIITGKFVRHSRAYYEWRIGDRQQKLEAKPNDSALIDDLAVAYAKLGRPEEGIPLLEEVLKEHPNRYETLSNLGTLLFFANRIDDSKTYIRRALEINPDAHFGREKYQLLLTEYLQQSEHEKLGVMSTQSRTPSEDEHRTFGFARFLARHDHIEVKKATIGVLGMMHFADFKSPILLEALGDLLLAGTTESDAALHACRAYLRAAELSVDRSSAERFRTMAKKSLRMHLSENILIRQIEFDLRGEVENAATWFAEIESSEQRWIAENRDVDLEFAAKYYDSLDSAIEAAKNELTPPSVSAEQVAPSGGNNSDTADDPAGRMLAYYLLCGAALAVLIASLRLLKSAKRGEVSRTVST